MEEEIAWYRCIGDDDTPLVVLEYAFTSRARTQTGSRSYPGARRLVLSTGEPVRYIDASTFEVIGTGELLRRSSHL